MTEATMVKPIDYETLWGVPRPEQEQPGIEHYKVDDWCPYKEKRCPFWDQGCQAEACVEGKDNG